MRVVGGEARGRKLRAPAGRSTRPTSDRVREAIFAILGSLPAECRVSLEGATVADLFAGSGALGIEALSRGARHATFVDTDREAARTIAENLAALDLQGGRATVVRHDVVRWLATAGPTDVVLCDPPYAFDRWQDLARLLEPVAKLAVLESDRPLDLGPAWEVVKEKHYGGTVVTVARPAKLADRAGDQKGDT
ncbi:MAG TPA: 16S rRNA (guanine(966)-N(2))-methyltransferase RsmD [Acidimicrobiales bacterium]|nr:16S rRNA (guanine(966)-N(2))-methyltransferase RsmD [Acidimicrobiales bacterium]